VGLGLGSTLLPGQIDLHLEGTEDALQLLGVHEVIFEMHRFHIVDLDLVGKGVEGLGFDRTLADVHLPLRSIEDPQLVR
jgi:hypothetical protein